MFDVMISLFIIQNFFTSPRYAAEAKRVREEQEKKRLKTKKADEEFQKKIRRIEREEKKKEKENRKKVKENKKATEDGKEEMAVEEISDYKGDDADKNEKGHLTMPLDSDDE